MVPRSTRTVADLAGCVETAFIRDAAGEAGTVAWAKFITVCGIKFAAGGPIVRGDAEVAAWVEREGGAAEVADVKRRMW